MTNEQANWDAVPLRSLCLETATIDPTKTPDKVFEYVDVSSVSNDLWKIVSSTRHTGATAPGRARKLVRAKDVIFATIRPSLKRVALVPQNLDGQVVSTAFSVLRANPIKADPRFIYYSLLTEDFISQVTNLERGASYPAVTDNDVLGQEIVVPPLLEQRAIAAVLSKIQAAGEVQEKLVATLKELKAATMAKLFREGIFPGFMFDTHIFDKILDGRIDLTQLKIGASLFVTHVQRNEIEKCKDKDRREQLLQTFQSVPQTMIPTESFVLGTSELGGAKVNDDSSIFEAIKKGNPKHTEDALIAETCIKQNLTLVTEEKDLPKWVQKAGGEAISFEDFLARRWRRLKQTEIGEIPESWEVVAVGALLKLRSGETRPSDLSTEQSETTPYPVYGGNGIMGYSSQYLTDEPAIIIGRVGVYCGSVHVCPLKSWVTDNALYHRDPANAKVSLHFLAELLSYVGLNRLHRKGAQPLVTQGTVHAVTIALPSKTEQEEIARTAKSVDARIQQAEARLASVRSLFSSMLHLFMTGQVRVTQKMIALQALEDRKKKQKNYSGKIDEKTLQKIVRRIVEAVQPEKIILFGSAARGEMGPDSDVDLLVIKSCTSKRRTWEIIEKKLDGIGVPKDIVVATPEDVEHCKDIPGYVIRYVLREGKVVYPS